MKLSACPRHARRVHGQQGAALLLVLWLVALLAVLVGGFAFAARTEQLLGRSAGDALRAQQAAHAGLDYALTRIGPPEQEGAWWADGRTYPWRIGEGGEAIAVEVEITDERGKVDLNQASPQLLAELIKALGVDASRAGPLAGAIVDWRDEDSLTQPGGGAEDADYAAAGRPYGAKDAPFAGISELQQVLGMDPALYRRLLPNVTVFAQTDSPDPVYAPHAVLLALQQDADSVIASRQAWQPGIGVMPLMPLAGFAGGGTFSVVSRARLAHGYEGELRAVVRLGPSGVPGASYTVLSWEEGALLQ